MTYAWSTKTGGSRSRQRLIGGEFTQKAIDKISKASNDGETAEGEHQIAPTLGWCAYTEGSQ